MFWEFGEQKGRKEFFSTAFNFFYFRVFYTSRIFVIA